MFRSKSLQSLREQVGQLLILGFEEQEMTPRVRSAIATLQPGGVILFARNLAHPAQTWELLRACDDAVATPLFRCVDMEGGTVDRLKQIVAPAPSAAEVFATGDRKAFREHGRVIGEECRALGFNVDFAPVFDLAYASSASVLGSRAVSDDPKKVIAYTREFLRGLADSKVLGCGKHYPGLGESDLDTHNDLPAIEKPWRKLWEQDLLPYRALRDKVDFVMVAHALYPAVKKEKVPASLSKHWMGVLRNKIGFKKLIVSDDLEMGGVLAAASIGEAAVETIRAGADMFLVCRDEEMVWRAYHAVLSEADRSRSFRAMVEDRAARVLQFKRKSAALNRPAPQPTQKIVDRLQRDVWEFAERVRLESIERANA